MQACHSASIRPQSRSRSSPEIAGGPRSADRTSAYPVASVPQCPRALSAEQMSQSRLPRDTKEVSASSLRHEPGVPVLPMSRKRTESEQEMESYIQHVTHTARTHPAFHMMRTTLRNDYAYWSVKVRKYQQDGGTFPLPERLLFSPLDAKYDKDLGKRSRSDVIKFAQQLIARVPGRYREFQRRMAAAAIDESSSKGA